jgi:hypothetical protein
MIFNYLDSVKNYSNNYRLIYRPNDAEHIAVVIPTGEVSIAGVKSRIIKNIGSVEFTDLSLDEFIKVSPKDRVFRNAWKLNSTGILEDINLSKNIIRDKRNKALKYLDDVAWSESRKPRGNVKLIDRVAQNLRDITKQAAFQSTDIYELKSLMNHINNTHNAVLLDKEIDAIYLENTLLMESTYLQKLKSLIAKRSATFFPLKLKTAI